MAKSRVKMSGKELKQLKEQLEAAGRDIDAFCGGCVKELSGRLLGAIIKETPTGRYPPGSGKTGGTLKRGWTTGKMTKGGSTYTVNVINPVEYAPYVEYGHRTRNHRGWVEGRFMMTKSVKKLQGKTNAIIQQRLKEYLEGHGG